MNRKSFVRAGRRALLATNRLAACPVLLVLLVLASCAPLMAQTAVFTGALSGRATDETGAVVPGVAIVLQNLDTGLKQSTETNHTGLYRFPVLTPGPYSITASCKDFRDVQALVRVLVGSTTLQDVKLQVGVGRDMVRVTGTAPLLRPAEASQ